MKVDECIMKQFFISIIVTCIFCLNVLPVHAGGTDDKKLKVYPNPVERNTVLTIEMLDDHGEKTVYLYNTVGKVIQTLKTTNKTIEINAPDVSGIYLLRIIDQKRVITVEKIVVKE